MTRRPPRFLIGAHPTRGQLWAAIDPNAKYLEAEIAERRFGAYLKPFLDEQSARDALFAAGAASIDEERARGNRRGLR